jgi:hypothetical protein
MLVVCSVQFWRKKSSGEFRPPITGCSIAEFLRLSSSCRKIRSKTALGDSRSDNLIPNSLLCIVEGELGVASFLVNYF